MIIVYQFPMYARLEPRTHPFNGGRITNTDLLTLDKAAKCASTHAGTEIAPGDFLLAAARGEIALRAIVHREARLQKYDGGIFCNQGMPTENTVPKGAIPTLPLSACQQLANAGRASWRTVDDFEHQDGVLMRFTVATLLENEPDFETVPTDCRVMGYDVHALADAFIDWPAAPSGSPVVTPAADFPTDDSEAATLTAPHTKALPAQRFQEEEIMRVISELGYSADALPKWVPGKPGVKAEVRGRFASWQGTVLDKAWGRLRADKRIRDAD